MKFRIESTLTIFSPEIESSILDKIDSNKAFTNVIDNDPRKVKSSSIALLAFGTEKITHICYLKKGQRVATGQVRVKATNIIPIKGFSLQEFLNESPESYRNKIKNAFGIGYQSVSTKTGEEMLRVLLKICPESKSDILNLFEKIQDRSSTTYVGFSAAEKDALGLCLDIFGIDRSKVLESRFNNVGNSFMSHIDGYTAYEDDIINNDLNNFPGYEQIKDNIIGTTEFENKDGEKLVVINANRKSLEKAMGVDLIYFNRRYEAFTFVQYKMMDNECDDEIYFNPNQKSHTVELERMNNVLQNWLSKSSNNSLRDYRLSTCPIFFKICTKLTSKANSFSIATGAYIPLDQWNILIKDPSTLGPRGGRQIGYHTLKNRYLGTPGFVQLVQKGFIGSYSLDSEKLGSFIQDRIEHGSSVIYAIDQRKKDNKKSLPEDEEEF